MEPYAKVGRGGAGNYYSSQDIQDAAEKLKEDTEAQQNNVAARIDEPDSHRPEYAHSGRGGAGNYQPTAAAPSAGTTGALSTSIPQGAASDGSYSGRGGAGNYRGSHAERRKSEALTREAEAQQQKAYEQTVRDVEQGLKQPEKAHVGSGKFDEQ